MDRSTGGARQGLREIASDDRLLAILDGLLAPNDLLSADQAICIHPGETARVLHFEDFLGVPKAKV
jgi:hypothetical protein